MSYSSVFRRGSVCVATLAVYLAMDALTARAQSTQLGSASVDFDREIRPILAGHCFACHGPDADKRQAELRLDVRADAIQSGALAPGDPQASALVARIFSPDDDEVMPPPEHGKPLSESQKASLQRWVQEGAEYKQHWSFRPLSRPAVPAAMEDPWCVNPIDAFVLARLRQEGVSPSPRAASARLLRRVSLDLLGLPPSEDESRKWTNDASQGASSSQAWANLVDALLQSPHYGERMAVPWLDVVRYADTVGFHGDQNQRIFPYRDYVIESFNENKPFDQFTIEQIAGDLLPDRTDEQLIASGFNRLNMMTREGGAQDKEYLAKYQADRVRTIGMAWLGLTTGCAECHDHKYDPFTTKDFYQLSAFFADIKQWGVYQDYDYTPNPEFAGFTNDHPFPPEIEVLNPHLLRRQVRLRAELARLARDVVENELSTLESPANSRANTEPTNTADDISSASSDLSARFKDWQESLGKWYANNPDGWETPYAVMSSPHDDITAQQDGSWLLHTKEVDGKPVLAESSMDRVRTWTLAPNEGSIACVRIELLPSTEHGGKLLREGNERDTIRVQFEIHKAGVKLRDVAVRRADANRQTFDYVNNHAVLDVAAQWKTPKLQSLKAGETLTAIYQFQQGQRLASDESLVVHLRGAAPGRVRLSVAPDARLRPWDAAAMEAVYAECGSNGFALPGGPASISYLLADCSSNEARSRAASLEAQYRECRDGFTFTQVTQSLEPRVTRILPRGDWQNEKGEVVQPALPEFLVPQPSLNHPLTRLDLAKWLVSPDNPLTARVVVNRLWAQVMGSGLAPSLDDFGAQGESPSHPELLDWLAVEFIESGWNIKHMVRLMVTSSTYQQDSKLRDDVRDRDPANRLLAYLSPRPLEAEFVRDQSLAASHLLNPEIGGPSVYPFQPPGYYSNLQFPDRDYVMDHDARRYRRGVYMHWQRTFLHPMLANFDAPSREDCVALRNRSNTPQQALTLLNDPNFLEAAASLAVRLQSIDYVKDDQRTAALFQAVLSRSPSDEEQASVLAFVDHQSDAFSENPQSVDAFLESTGAAKLEGFHPPKEAAGRARLCAWIAACRVLFNTQEAITRY